MPPRYPEVIVYPRTDEEAVAAVRLARTRTHHRNALGRHSWAASFLRDGGMLIDFSE